jgi:ABC-type branched-subunit amino acid transport system permease subunit
MDTKQAEQKESMMKREWWIALLIIAAIAAPFVISEFYLTILGEALIMSLLALSFNLLFGYMGLFLDLDACLWSAHLFCHL